MAWFKREKKSIEQTTPPEERRVRTEGLWVKCESCRTIVFRKDLEANLHVCPKCQFHFKMSARPRLEMLLDGRWTEHDAGMTSTDPLKFVDTKPYAQRLKEARKKLGMNDAIITAEGQLNGRPVVMCAMEFSFIGGSMGAVVGEKVTRGIELFIETRQPFIAVSCSGGARMMEGTVSLMQLAKVSSALAKLDDEKLPYISVLTDPTTGGVTASFAMLGDLENITGLAERLGRPDRAYPNVHIAGTNGKGSTAAFLESILRHAGFRTGLYTSPHLEKINERMRINGEEISDESFAALFTRLQALIEELLATHKLRAHPTYFECLTAMAFECFAHERVEFGVFEVGLGGRLDATNILSPAVMMITRIDFDHENFLGHSLREIASEKAGILKPDVPVVLAEQRPEAREVVLARAQSLGCPVIEASSRTVFEIAPSLPGRFQLQNALNAVAAARQL